MKDLQLRFTKWMFMGAAMLNFIVGIMGWGPWPWTTYTITSFACYAVARTFHLELMMRDFARKLPYILFNTEFKAR